MPYEQRVVGFVDILGFGELVRRADREPVLREEIIRALNTVRSHVWLGGGDTDLRTQNFSDSLILTACNTADGFWHLLLSMEALAWNLLQAGVLVRGGVTVGGVHHDEQIVFGVGVNEAYRLESTVAKMPRIVLGSRAVTAALIFSAQAEYAKVYLQARLRRDRDGVWFLNYLTEIGVFNGQDPDGPDMREHPFFDVGESIRKIIQDKVDSTLDQPDVYVKVEWLAQYWNREIAGAHQDGKQPVLGPVILAGQ
ncbi:hypothetical protein GOC67_28810 [Sinorhizobium medicae]|uniref:hypothetical protein n=1 Tax=Rhizobium meliloti TaxID=382 RepID=UPI00299DAA2C|nr:hypothetical protein [Sinorhizobium medicae]MDX1176959.1 hypothetical protein [Sinorhizobium medicae]